MIRFLFISLVILSISDQFIERFIRASSAVQGLSSAAHGTSCGNVQDIISIILFTSSLQDHHRLLTRSERERESIPEALCTENRPVMLLVSLSRLLEFIEYPRRQQFHPFRSPNSHYLYPAQLAELHPFQ